MRDVQYRSLEEISDLERVVDLEIEIWQVDPRDATPASVMHAHVASGGLVVGAYDDDHLVGLALAFPGWRDKLAILWSHMAGVLPDYQGRGIGFGLKQFQRIWALERGYTTIAWTYDPLQAGNANFNLHRLGGVSKTYRVNFYGEMRDGINAGLPSDRLEVLWNLRDARVGKLAAGGLSESDRVRSGTLFALCADDMGRPQVDLSVLHAYRQSFAEIPVDLAQLKRIDKDLALAWRLALREVLQTAFAKGYNAVDFVSVDGRSCYVLAVSDLWFLYVVECSDGSLYTGIARDVEKRIRVHNSGRGAAYTASRRPVRLLAAWRFVGHGEVLKAELRMKKLSRAHKLRWTGSQENFSGGTFVKFD